MISRAESLVEGARSDSVTVNSLTNGENKLVFGGMGSNQPVISYILESEQPHFIFQITPDTTAITISGSDGTIESNPNEGYGPGGWFVVSDMRVLMIVNAPHEDEVISIPLGSNIVSVKLEDNGFLRGTNLVIDTQDYKYKLLEPHKFNNEALRYIRNECGANQSEVEEVHYLSERETEFMCKKCKQEVSPDAKKCPHCGYYPGKGGKGALWHLSSVFVWPMAVKGAADEIRTRRGIAEESAKTQEEAVNDPADEDPFETIERLKELYENGAISDEEFQSKKEEILDRL